MRSSRFTLFTDKFLCQTMSLPPLRGNDEWNNEIQTLGYPNSFLSPQHEATNVKLPSPISYPAQVIFTPNIWLWHHCFHDKTAVKVLKYCMHQTTVKKWPIKHLCIYLFDVPLIPLNTVWFTDVSCKENKGVLQLWTLSTHDCFLKFSLLNSAAVCGPEMLIRELLFVRKGSIPDSFKHISSLYTHTRTHTSGEITWTYHKLYHKYYSPNPNLNH